jgi:hypothetical protein
MPSFKLKGSKAQEAKSGFEPYDGPVPSRNGFYRAIIKVMKWGANSSGSSGFSITAELQAAPGDPKNHAQFDGYPMFSRSIITESGDGGALKEGAQRNLDNLLAALGTKDEPDVVLADDDGDKVDVKKIGGKNPIGAVVNIDLQMKMYEGERRPEVGGIYKYKEIDAPAKSATVVTDDDDDEADLMEGDDEAEETEGDEEYDARAEELDGMKIVALRSLAKELGAKSSGTKEVVIEAILAAEFPEDEESDEDDAAEEPDEDDADEAEEADEDEAEDDEEEDDEAEEADEEDDEEREARVAELADLNRVALKSILKEIAPDFTVLKRHTDDNLREQIISVEFADDLPF